jgi:hypothetical protein
MPPCSSHDTPQQVLLAARHLAPPFLLIRGDARRGGRRRRHRPAGGSLLHTALIEVAETHEVSSFAARPAPVALEGPA